MAKDYGTIIYRKETRSYVVGKLCVPHPDDDTVPDEVRRQFAELWADVDAYAEAHPEMVTEEQPYVPPVPTLDEVKAAKLSEINAAADRAIATLTATYPDRELATFDKQESEARAYAADATASTPLLSALAQARGIPLDELVRRVLAKADAFAVASGSIIGQRQALEDRLDVCTTVEEVQSIAVNIVMPGEEVSA
ncbi:hypothetical protein [uncultured Bilophila sp.]|uniref:hypothetical protein n=1 Tax=uncultured Bilophila sp. TaxID=529385 RepID=UPI0025934741|nr:hypothetical protein [uncultured Bilophila sp.]